MDTINYIVPFIICMLKEVTRLSAKYPVMETIRMVAFMLSIWEQVALRSSHQLY